MKKTLVGYLGVGLLIATMAPSVLTLGQTGQPESVGASAYAPHPNITKAIRALQGAKEEMERADHDFCGHRVEALAATNAAHNQLEQAIGCEDAKHRNSAESAEIDYEAAGGAREPHPYIRGAINALNAAKRDLNVAAHVYCGHRAEALEAVNHALEQLQRALKCDKH